MMINDRQELLKLSAPPAQGQFRRADHGDHHSFGGRADFRVLGAEGRRSLEKNQHFLLDFGSKVGEIILLWLSCTFF